MISTALNLCHPVVAPKGRQGRGLQHWPLVVLHCVSTQVVAVVAIAGVLITVPITATTRGFLLAVAGRLGCCCCSRG